MRRLGHMTQPNRQGHIGGGPYRIGAHDFRQNSWKQGNFTFAAATNSANTANGMVQAGGGLAYGMNYDRSLIYGGKSHIVKITWQLQTTDVGEQCFSFRDRGGALNGAGTVIRFSGADVNCIVRDMAGGVWTDRSSSPTVGPTNQQVYTQVINFPSERISSVWSSAAATPINKTRLQVNCPAWAAYTPSAANTPTLGIEGVGTDTASDKVADYIEVFVW